MLLGALHVLDVLTDFFLSQELRAREAVFSHTTGSKVHRAVHASGVTSIVC